MKILMAGLALAATLGGCAVYTPSGSVVVDPHSDGYYDGGYYDNGYYGGGYYGGGGYYRDDDDDDRGGGGYYRGGGGGGFCPPGQAKKGNC